MCVVVLGGDRKILNVDVLWICIVVNYVTLGMSSCVSILQSFNSVLSACLICDVYRLFSVPQQTQCLESTQLLYKEESWFTFHISAQWTHLLMVINMLSLIGANYFKHHEKNSLIHFILSGENKLIFDR